MHMPKRLKKNPKRPTDVNQIARYLVDASTRLSSEEQAELDAKLRAAHAEAIAIMPTPSQISLLMAELGRRGGEIGGKRRLQTMTREQRRKLARKAAKTRWAKHKHSTQ
jgi:hypothetical protein